MNYQNLLPNGSIVKLKGGERNVMICGIITSKSQYTSDILIIMI